MCHLTTIVISVIAACMYIWIELCLFGITVNIFIIVIVQYTVFCCRHNNVFYLYCLDVSFINALCSLVIDFSSRFMKLSNECTILVKPLEKFC